MSDNSDSFEQEGSFNHHDFDVIEVDPENLEIDEVNERTTNTGPRTDLGDLEKSVAKNGIEDPPQARPTENGDGYKVFAGQRRVQAAQTVGLRKIPILVKNLNDMEALAASVNENNEHLKKDVSRKDRAKAIQKLEGNWSRDEIAEKFGVNPVTIGNWLEPTRDFWSDTIFDADNDPELNTEYIADDILADLRRIFTDPSNAERAARIIIEKQFPKTVVRRAINETSSPTNFVRELKNQWKAVSAGAEEVRPRITLTGEDAKELKEWAKDRGVGTEEAVKQIVLDELYDE